MDERGITFLELVIVISILSIMGVSIFIKLGQSLSIHELDSVSLELAADIRWLQQLAINGGNEHVSYILNLNESTPCSYEIKLNNKLLKKNIFPPSVKVCDSYITIGFGLSGAPLTGAQTISLQSTKLKTFKHVILAPVTGRVRISNNLPKNPQQGED